MAVRRLLLNHFGKADLRQLTFGLEVPLDLFSSDSKGYQDRVLDVIEYCQRRGQLPALERAIYAERPDLRRR